MIKILIAAAALLLLWPKQARGNVQVGTVTGSVDMPANATRGERNNNPGNIKYSLLNPWQGQTGHDPEGFCTFDTPENGIRAIAHILKHYKASHSINTVDAAIRRWSSTDQDAYVRNVANVMEIDPFAPIDLEDPQTLDLMVRGIIYQENGRVIYSVNQINAAVDAA